MSTRKTCCTEKLLPRDFFPRNPKTVSGGNLFEGKFLGEKFLDGKVSVINPTTRLDFPEITKIMDCLENFEILDLLHIPEISDWPDILYFPAIPEIMDFTHINEILDLLAILEIFAKSNQIRDF